MSDVVVESMEQLQHLARDGALRGHSYRDLQAPGLRVSSADFSGATFERCTLDGATLETVDFSRTTLKRVTLRRAQLAEATAQEHRSHKAETELEASLAALRQESARGAEPPPPPREA